MSFVLRKGLFLAFAAAIAVILSTIFVLVLKQYLTVRGVYRRQCARARV